jgi:hypothetical protein
MSDNDNGEKKRPNANYKLSHEKASENQLTFFYDRERRLAKAPKAVQDMYNNPMVPRFNLIKPLVRTKPLAMMFASIVIICLFILAISFLGLASDTRDLEGNQISIQAIRYEGAIIVAVDKIVRETGLARFLRSDAAYTGAVDIAVQPVVKTDSGQGWQPENIFYHRIFFTLEQEEHYRFSIPFDTGELAFVFKTETKTVGLTVKAK